MGYRRLFAPADGASVPLGRSGSVAGGAADKQYACPQQHAQQNTCGCFHFTHRAVWLPFGNIAAWAAWPAAFRIYNARGRRLVAREDFLLRGRGRCEAGAAFEGGCRRRARLSKNQKKRACNSFALVL